MKCFEFFFILFAFQFCVCLLQTSNSDEKPAQLSSLLNKNALPISNEDIYTAKPNDLHEFASIFSPRNLKLSKKKIKSNKYRKQSVKKSRKRSLNLKKKRNVKKSRKTKLLNAQKSLLQKIAPNGNVTLRKLMTIMQATSPKLYSQLQHLNNHQKVRLLNSMGAQGGAAGGGNLSRFIAVLGGGFVFKVIMDRIVQHLEFTDLRELAEEKIGILTQSRAQKRRELTELQNDILELENKLETLAESTASKVTELNGWVDSHRF